MTDQPKWTPGPWAVEDHDGKTWVVAYCGDDDPWFVCEPEPFIGPGTIDRAPANAHLIAAAPDMAGVSPRAAEMLRVAATLLRSEEPNGTVFYDGASCDAFCIADDCEAAADDIDAALAKARGETK